MTEICQTKALILTQNIVKVKTMRLATILALMFNLSGCETLNFDNAGERWCKSASNCTVHDKDANQESLNKLKGKR